MKTYSNNFKRGQSVLIVVVMFLVISLTIVLGVAGPVMKQVKSSQDFISSRQSYMVAEAGMEDALYRIKNSMAISSVESLTLDGRTVETTIADTGSGKTITSDGNSDNAQRSIQTTVETGEGLSFSYALQSGNGGFSISGGSTVNGSVYANGNITGNSGTITGSAIAADSKALVADQSNTAPATPPNSIQFANVSASQDLAQSFQLADTGVLNKIRLNVKKTGAPGNLTVRIAYDNGGVPSTSSVDTATLAASTITTSYGWVNVLFSNYIQLTAGTTYWIVLDGAANSSNNYTMAANSAYANGTAKLGTFSSGTWSNTSPSGLDAYFEVYTGGITSQINGQDGSWDLSIGGDSWANVVNKTSTAGTIYCQTGTGNANGKTCNTTRADPSPQNFPVSDANIQEWKDDASVGWTYNGNLTIGYAGTTTGPLKVNGNLTINGGGTFTMTGPVWVTGTITVTGGGKVALSSAYGSKSGILVADGIISVSGGGQFAGSGQTGSYPFLVTTSSCPTGPACGGANALSVSGGAGAVVLLAPYGTLYLNGGSSAKAMTAYKTVIDGGGTVVYDSGLVSAGIYGGPTGSWNISSWKEVQ